MTDYGRVALFGGLYSNYVALESAIADVARRDVDACWCLGDLGAFGPHPDRVFPLLREAGISCIQGNYDLSIGNALDDCRCGYTDPADNYFAQLSYEYTLANTSESNRAFLRSLEEQVRLSIGPFQVLLCHGSPRRINEFLWESTCSTHFLSSLCTAYGCDVIAATHTGIKWHRPLLENRHFVNVGVLGRPENDGTSRVWYTILDGTDGMLQVEFIPIEYDYKELARQMKKESLPEEFIQTVETGWWTSCLEVLPSRERRRGKW